MFFQLNHYLCFNQSNLMKIISFLTYALPASFLFFSCQSKEKIETFNEGNSSENLALNYTKQETYIEMRDGVKLFTTIYSPKDTTQTYPVILKRTPYGAKPYGLDTLPKRILHNEELVKSGYIFVIQDVRGRWMSEGVFENTKPPYSFQDSSRTDEITDSWDTFDWFLDSLKNYNGNAGMLGNSYLGWTTLVGARCNHPSLKAVMAMAPVTNFFFEDFNRYGLFALNYLPVLGSFGTPKDTPSDTAWWPDRSEEFGIDEDLGIQPDYYDFFLDRFTLNNYTDILDSTDFFWKNIKAHPTYDAYRKERNWLQYFNDINCQVMVVGGWNDEQNLFGILNSYKHIAENSPKANAQFVMGPWSHGHPVRNDSAYYLGDVFYGYELSKNFMHDIEFNYFEKHLKGEGEAPDFTVKLYDTGKNEWSYFDAYPEIKEKKTYYLSEGSLMTTEKKQEISFSAYVSDPFHPVPYIEDDNFHRMAPKSYFTADQRFASKRPDVLTFETGELTEDITVLGEVKAMIDFATDHNAADLYVKVIDVYPMDREPLETDLENVKMNGYQQLVRCGYIRGRFRNGFENGEPFVANQQTQVSVPLLDLYHTFKKGHKIMIQVQSSWFPLFDLNPQNYVDDIYSAKKEDFTKAIHKVFSSSRIEMPIYKK